MFPPFCSQTIVCITMIYATPSSPSWCSKATGRRCPTPSLSTERKSFLRKSASNVYYSLCTMHICFQCTILISSLSYNTVTTCTGILYLLLKQTPRRTGWGLTWLNSFCVQTIPSYQVDRQSAEAVECQQASLPALLQGPHQWEELRRPGLQWRLCCLW